MAERIKNLVIVESPAKAKTIEKYLGKDFVVKSSMGHIRDLKKGDDAIRIDQGFQPVYEVQAEKKKLVNELRQLAKKADLIWLATDEDREGEAISWHLYDELGLSDAQTNRIVFNEITKPAITHAVENPRKIDRHLVDAQQARRVLDRLVGYELSPILWRKVKPSLSAGRVQSVTVRLIVEREREIKDFNSTSEFKVVAVFTTAGGKAFKAELDKRFANETQARDFLESCKRTAFKVLDIEVKPTFRNPAAPFTTSTLQQEASRKLGFSVSQTMQVAQKLYENGHITYMRTDSVNLSKLAIGAAAKEIGVLFGEKYSNPRNFTTKNESAQEAHEAIRPTYFNEQDAGSTLQERKLYSLIWKRAIASQMARAELEKTIIRINTSNDSMRFIAEGEVVKFDGFLRVYEEGQDDPGDDQEAALLPKVSPQEDLQCQGITATERYSRPAPRYTEASLVKKLEELGIGRPSTYAPTISTVQKREYVVKDNRDGVQRQYITLELKEGEIGRAVKTETTGQEKNKLFPTDIGILVTDFLAANFPEIMDYGFTASVEKEFDEIAEGKMSWVDMIGTFYEPFHTHVNKTLNEAVRVTGERIIGKDPKSGQTVLVRMGRFGPLVQIGTKEESETPRYASLRKEQSLESINLEDALDLFKLPREVLQLEGEPVIAAIGRYGPYLKHRDQFYNIPKGTDPLSMTEVEALALIEAARSAPKLPIALGDYNGQAIQVNKGRFGPYIKFGDIFVNIPKGEDMFTLSLDRAIELIAAKQKTEAAKIIKEFPENTELRILNGRYGPYIAYKKGNYVIPKDTDPSAITLQQAIAIIAEKDKAGGTKTTGKTRTTGAKKAANTKPAARTKKK
jgi:DNA topoisomerase I